MQADNQVKFQMEANNFYREERFTDMQVATIRKFIPVNQEGNDDPARAIIFMGQTNLRTPDGGAVTVSVELGTGTLAQAIAAFPGAIAGEIEEMMAAARERQRAVASRIIVPGPVPDGNGMPSMPRLKR